MNNNKVLSEDLISFLSENLSESEVMLIRAQAKIASTLHGERIRRKMTQKEFAEILEVSQGMISKWESGEYNFTLESLSQVCCKLNIEMNITIAEESCAQEYRSMVNTFRFKRQRWGTIKNKETYPIKNNTVYAYGFGSAI